ncbi:non-hydrolyzing UDP-N-acetylglucosamine 2-epimerase [Haloplasma contractile]|uniref:UDP-N-acetylglucosamine 2-epimerase (non-hydrolyzing) n=1 Tax=Haloplasma contractile SSD-17B TaxID=1033810 RepID=F7Q1K0_9MOLU|nr:UDP-N-acetylglucosamine 2-epimerase (non-hydrolyzing) [Haloplasma contractile]ERJ12931.1 UDP-N-acetylglucosamine 2-epimerase protein [Haloplasma contractile SSD-17B]
MNKRFKVLVIMGTRPEAIKMAPLIKKLKEEKEIDTKVCVTAQHREMLDQVLDLFDIVPDYDLNIMKKNQSLVTVTTRALTGIDEVIDRVKPSIVLVHGDTTTTLSGALAAYYKKVPIGHVEAGLRTYNKYSPYPEEMNRQLTSNLADLHFAPTIKSKQNLLNEGKSNNQIIVTGNTAIDALKTTVVKNYQHKHLSFVKDDEQLLLMTAHRRENIGVNMENMFYALLDIVNEFKTVKVIYPVHLNPKVKEIANRILNHERIRLIEPLDVTDFHNFMNRSHLILTDSGGIQEEAPTLGKPVLVLRDTTERPEGIKAGTLKLVGTNKDRIYREIKTLLTDKNAYIQMAQATNPYGDGFASNRIVKALLDFYKDNLS